MKKLLSLLLAITLCVSLGAILSSCEHEHVTAEEWSYDDTYHWRKCSVEGCPDVFENAEHTWNEGVISTEPLPGSDGEKTYTCNVCGATIGETVEFEGLSEKKWEEMLSAPTFENYTLTQSGLVTYTVDGVNGGTIKQDYVVKFTSDKVHLSLKLGDTPAEEITYIGEEAAFQKNSYENLFLALLDDIDNFTYDETEKVYRNSAPITVELDGDGVYAMSAVIVMQDGELSLTDDGKLLKFTCDYKQTTVTPEGTSVGTTQMTWTFSDYGTTVID